VTQAPVSQWPRGDEKIRIGELRGSQAQDLSISYDDIESVAGLELVLFDRDGNVGHVREIETATNMSLALSDDEIEVANSIGSGLYAILARSKDGRRQLIVKGRVNCQIATSK
jgi:hypothetical protein